jgi:ankyrin repeat protein
MKNRRSGAVRAAALAALFLFHPFQACLGNPSDSGLSALARVLQRGKWTAADVAYVRRLLHRGESIRTTAPRGVTLLMFAAKAGDLSLVRAALAGGVDVRARTDQGWTALHYVMSSRSEEKLRALLNAGADVGAADRGGRTPLMLATHFKFREGIRMLLTRGARIDARNRNGRTVLAYTDDHPGVTALLLNHGAAP